MAPHRLSRDDARRIAVRAQLLDADRPGDPVEVAEQLGAIKIDPTSVIAPCEHTMLWARLGFPYEPGQLAKAVERDRLLLELDGAFRPMSLLPHLLVELRRWTERDRIRDWVAANARFRTDVLARLRAEGPLLAAAIPDTAAVARPNDSGWYSDNQVPRMLEVLALQGEVAVSRREGRNRVWDLAERVYPGDLADPTPEEARRAMAERRVRAAGIARHSGWTPVRDAGEPVEVEGLQGVWRVDPEALAALDDDPGGRVAFLNPYDGMLADRRRLDDLFGFHYVLQQFKPKPERRYGLFAHPILLGDRFAGMLEATADRKAGVLHVAAVHEFLPFDEEERESVRAEVLELSRWLGLPLSDTSDV
ncbi:DNA glycosylase AlkZ-like family protein [uncultured Amnibacterium sp.]|uniref:DNA glycosylase AlkZ-like family protein n=1 Tax=uncultured Amnibacterium sp. TaxID=1631851 RepID=UPI0035CC93F4